MRSLGTGFALWMAVAAGAQPANGATTPAHVTADRLLGAAAEPSQWMTYGGTYDEQRFTRLKGINRDNVRKLGLQWFADYDTNLTQAGTPLYIDGVIYVSTAWSKVYAFDARTGKTLWQYDPKTPGEWIRNVCCGIVNRGIAAWNGKIYIGSLDGRLVAIDAKTGREAWSTQTFDKTKHYSITGAPRIVKGRVLTGVSGGEYGVRGYLSAYDAESGKLDWRFYTVPASVTGPFETKALQKAAATWSAEGLRLGGGGGVWDSIVYDTETDLLYFGTGNGSPWNDRFRDPSMGDNLYLASIMAVKPDTGEYVWHYQTVPADTWDYDAASPMTLANLTFDGSKRRVILQPNKNGFLYVLDAKSGRLLRADPFTAVNWADGVDLKTGRPRVRPEARFPLGQPFNLAPGVQGAHGWHSNAYDPNTGVLYVATQLAYWPMVSDSSFTPNPVGYNLGIDFTAPGTYYQSHPNDKQGFTGYLQAIDAATGKQLWKSESNEGPTGGAVATAGGLVFQGGGASNEVRAFDARSGEKLWSMQVQTAIVAAPISYELDGRQFVAFSVGGNAAGGYYAPNYSRMLVFALNGTLQLPPEKEFTPRPLNPPPSTASADVIEAGNKKYSDNCAACHGDRGQTRGANFPDLTRTPLLYTQEGFDSIVLHGALVERGMASFAAVLKPDDTVAIRSFLIKRANDVKDATPLPGTPGAPAVSQPHQ